MQSKRCGQCGTYNVVTSHFCRNCGVPLPDGDILDIDLSKAPPKRKRDIKVKSSVGSVWLSLSEFFAWLVFLVILACGFFGGYFIAQVQHDINMGVFIFVADIPIAIFSLARIMVSLNMEQNIASATDNTSEILKLLAEENNHRIGEE